MKDPVAAIQVNPFSAKGMNNVTCMHACPARLCIYLLTMLVCVAVQMFVGCVCSYKSMTEACTTMPELRTFGFCGI